MNFTTLKKILLRLYQSYVKKYFNKLIISLLLSLGVAGSTATIAWLLDPAIEKMFIEQDETMMLLIPIAIVLAFATKGTTLYFARTVLIRMGGDIVLTIQKQLASSKLKSAISSSIGGSLIPSTVIVTIDSLEFKKPSFAIYVNVSYCDILCIISL